MFRRILLLGVLAAVAVLVSSAVANADSPPTGERSFHNATLEPFYNAENSGQIGFLLTPNKAPMHANPAAWSPLYIVVYPVGTTAATTLNCMHLPFENCPSHGDLVAGAAWGISHDPGLDTLFPDFASVYAGGVLGHDHVGDFPGGADFNFAWEPVLVLFTNPQAANEHLLTDTEIQAAVDRGDAIEVPAPDLTFNCASVSATIWNMATPIIAS